ncbi:MAG TPA: DUF4124 domain-containing protein [Rhodanobacteraceae bacterium]|nr:DUF4124 domain-containing protein [Rhodanobacteraceae bacterium]
MAASRTSPCQRRPAHRPARLTRAVGVLCLLGIVPCAQAASIHRCVDARGNVAYQDVPCAAGTQGSELALTPQPAIGGTGEAASRTAGASHRSTPPAQRARATRMPRAKPAVSWECRTADGELFYRHTRCPASVPGDGVVRNAFTERTTRKPRRSARGAWERVPVQGRKLPRAVACERIRAPAAAVRDGHLRDEHVATYDHLMGRDPCTGA